MSHAPPPMQMPPAYAYPPPPPARTNALAIVSLVTGILGCMLITPFVAIITGILGIRATRDPAVRGRGLAIAGLILGLLWLLSVAATGAGVGVFLKNSQAPVAVAHQFTADVIAGDYPAALANAAPILVDETAIRTLHDQAAAGGAITEITLPSRSAFKNGGATKWTLAGTITFATGGTKGVEYVLQSKPNGGFQVTAFKVQ